MVAPLGLAPRSVSNSANDGWNRVPHSHATKDNGKKFANKPNVVELTNHHGGSAMRGTYVPHSLGFN